MNEAVGRFSRPGARVAVAMALLLLAAACTVAGVQWRADHRHQQVARALTGGDPARGAALVRRYGCGGCHTISAVGGADGVVGPPLDHLRGRVYIAGHLRHTPDNLVRWIVSPRSFSPDTAMPATGITESEARDVAALLYAQGSP